MEQYDSTRRYSRGAQVTYMGDEYQAIRDVDRGRTPTFNTFDWRKTSEIDSGLGSSSKSNDDDDNDSGLGMLGSLAAGALSIGSELFSGGGGDFGGGGGGGDV